MKKRIFRFWEGYKYRFVPWIAANLKSRSARCVEASQDNIIPDSTVNSSLVKLFTALNDNEKLSPPLQLIKCSAKDQLNGFCQKLNTQRAKGDDYCLSKEEFNVLEIPAIQYYLFLIREKIYEVFFQNVIKLHTGRNLQLFLHSLYHHFGTFRSDVSPLFGKTCGVVLENISSDFFQGQRLWLCSTSQRQDLLKEKSSNVEQGSNTTEGGRGSPQNDPSNVMLDTFKFTIEQKASRLPGGGTGVFVGCGFIPKHHIVAMYPGTIYLPSEPILLQSLGNPFIFRCADGLLIDGYDKRISKIIYRSCSKRDRLAPDLASSDLTWMTNYPRNPLNVGQYINNHSKDLAANVAYQEYNVDHEFPIHLRKYLPNVFYSAGLLHQRPLRTVVLVSLRDINAGEELLSSYFTLIH